MGNNFSKANDAARDAITDAIAVYQEKVIEYCKRWRIDPVESLAGTRHVHNVLMFNDDREGIVLTVQFAFSQKLSKDTIQKIEKHVLENGRHTEEFH